MTQPAVTQHVQYFEQLYGCKLFDYTNKGLRKTPQCAQLEKTARAVLAMHLAAQQTLAGSEKPTLQIGATKTIGEYLLNHALPSLLSASDYAVSITIDNTENLLAKLKSFSLDVLMLEGFVEKENYPCLPICTQEMVGICAKTHPFAGRVVPLGEAFAQHAILREQGSGTRAVFEQFLRGQGHSVSQFAQRTTISSNKLIAAAIAQGGAVSFVYDLIPQQHSELATFRLAEGQIFHPFHYVFLNQAKADALQGLLHPF